VMTGGTAQLDNFDKLMTKETNVPAFVAEDAMMCVVKGTGIVLESFDKFGRSVSTK
jgi:rod shape-determining protein MreB